MASNLGASAQGSSSRSLQDAMVRLLAKFFKADWSGALLAILIISRLSSLQPVACRFSNRPTS